MYKNVWLLFVMLFILSCQNKQSDFDVIDASTLSDIDQTAYLTGMDLRSLIEKNQNITLIDIRSIAEYNESHIEGAIHIPLKDLMSVETREVIGESVGPVVIYGNSFEEIHGPFMLLNSLHDSDLKILRESYATFSSPDLDIELALDAAKFDFQKEWEDLMANTKIEAPEAEIPTVAQARKNVAPTAKKSIPVIPKKKVEEEEEGC